MSIANQFPTAHHYRLMLQALAFQIRAARPLQQCKREYYHHGNVPLQTARAILKNTSRLTLRGVTCKGCPKIPAIICCHHDQLHCPLLTPRTRWRHKANSDEITMDGIPMPHGLALQTHAAAGLPKITSDNSRHGQLHCPGASVGIRQQTLEPHPSGHGSDVANPMQTDVDIMSARQTIV